MTPVKAALLLLIICACISCSREVDENDPDLLLKLMQERPSEFSEILKNKNKYEVQIIYTRIDRDSLNNPSFTSFEYNVDPDRYFYPASTVKMPIAFLALEKLNELDVHGLDRNTAMLTDSAYSGQSAVLHDSTAEKGMPTIAQYVREIFVVSDNDAFNRLYEFVGPGEIRKSLKSKGFNNSRIVHRLSIALTEDENRHTNPIRFISNDSVIYEQDAAFYEGPLGISTGIPKGAGYLRGDSVIMEPMEFGGKNFIPLGELTGILQRIIFPESFPETQRFNLSNDDLLFVRTCMSQLPRETEYPAYPDDEYYDAYSKFLLYGSDSSIQIPTNIRIFNKIGLAYGYTTDVAYIVDFDKNVEFMLSAVIHTNDNRIYNDGEYEYEEIAFPFMKNLGKLMYEFELQRERPNRPDLAEFRLQYNQLK